MRSLLSRLARVALRGQEGITLVMALGVRSSPRASACEYAEKLARGADRKLVREL
jgi:hypothetical protein